MLLEIALEDQIANPGEADRDTWFEEEAKQDEDEGESAPEARPAYTEEEKLQALEKVHEMLSKQGALDWVEEDAWVKDDAR